MSRRANTGFKDGWYTLPAGHVKPGERFAEAAVREAREETGVSILAQDVVVRTLMHRPNKQRGALLTRM
jgi:8-oxo-dGTP pyrophosphatase MutT (NUDIX family)